MLYLNCPLSFSAPLTDKPPKILFPSENKISNMELQLGKSIMGFPPAAYLSHFQMTGNGWLYKSSSTHLQALNTDWWWHFANSERKGQQFSKCFPYMQMVGANVPKAVLSTMKSPYGARVPYTGSPHGNAATFSRCCLSSLTWGHSGSTVCECARVGKSPCLFVVFFFLCDSILLDFWAQSAVHMVLAAWRMAYVSVAMKPMGEDWEVWEAREGLDEYATEGEAVGGGSQRRCNASLRRYPVFHAMQLESR